MEKISLPTKVNIKQEGNIGSVVIEPCYPGYGITIGNALRRVLLSSLPGSSVSAFKIKGVQHEFATITGVKEDVVEIMMNLKNLSLKINTDEPVELALKVKGEKVVKAGDIVKNSDVEVVNQDMVICHLTDKNAELDMKIWAERGLGYVPVEERKGEKAEVGVIQVDAVYTPVQKAGITKENVRVGERTDYDKLTLDIETDGSITIKEAMKQAGELLVEQFSYVSVASEGDVVKKEVEEVEETKEETEKQENKEIKDEEGEDEKEEEKTEEVEEKPKKRGRPKKSESK